MLMTALSCPAMLVPVTINGRTGKIMDQMPDEVQALLKAVHKAHAAELAGLMTALEEECGPAATAVVDRVRLAAALGEVRARLRDNGADSASPEALVRALWEPLAAKHFAFTLERTGDGRKVRCTFCPWAALYRELGASDVGYRLFCALDEPLVRALAPTVTFTRTKTLMEGDDCCDHCYRFGMDLV